LAKNDAPAAPSRGPPLGGFNFGKAVFEIAIVAIGVLLALAVDEARQARENRELADQAISAMRAELVENRSRFIRKLDFLQRAYLVLDSEPSRAGQLVADRRNQQITPSKAAWVMTVETGALRLLPPAERNRFAMVYTSQETYYDIVSQEMAYWGGLAAFDANDRSPESVRDRDRALHLWKAWANRVTLGICISAARIELALHPQLSRERLWGTCRTHRVTQPPADLYRGFGVAMPAVGTFF
jgi:hypothetical protein